MATTFVFICVLSIVMSVRCDTDNDLADIISAERTADIPVNVTFSNSSTCTEVRQVFALKKIGSVEDADVSEGTKLSLCDSSSGTCCTKSMEQAYREAVKQDFANMMQSCSTYLKTLLTTGSEKFRENFLEMIHVSQNNTNVLFSEVYKKMESVAQIPVSQLYSHLASYVLGHDVNLESRVAAFFDSLFPLVYHHSINPKLKDFSEDYKECLRETQHEIRPFGDIASRITLQVTRSFRVARILLEALEMGFDVINATDHMTFTEECTSGLVKLVYCAHCSGYLNVKPCSGYCLNIARGCLATVAELDQSWSDYITGLERLTSGLVASYNIEEVLSVLDTKISEAIMHAMENGPELSKRVKIACGHPRRATRDVTEPTTVPMSSAGRIVSVRTSEDTLYIRLHNLVQKLAETKGQYANLADILCSDDSWAVRKEGQCWNGQSLGEYTKTIAGVGVAAQRYNPEMKAPLADDMFVLTLGSKLRRMSERLKQSVMAEKPQSDSYLAEGSGSGGWTQNQIGDDEDYDKESSGSWGSGDGGGTKASDFNFESSDNRHRDVNIKVSDGALYVTCNMCFVAFISFVSIILQSRYIVYL